MPEDLSNQLSSGKEAENSQQFTQLRKEVHWKMADAIMERRKNKPELTPEEAELGIYEEELEPQVREAVFELNRKGYKTDSSGFNGTDTQHQYIEGNFLIDDETKQRLAMMGVEVKTEPSWKWKLDERMGEADPDAPEEAKVLTTIKFRSELPDLHYMEKRWQEIAAIFPKRAKLPQISP